VPELDERLGLSALIAKNMMDDRGGKNTRCRSRICCDSPSTVAWPDTKMRTMQQRLVKTGGRLVKHARYYWLLLAEGHLNRRRSGAMLGRIVLLPLRTG
jgi:hypothetical protein